MVFCKVHRHNKMDAERERNVYEVVAHPAIERRRSGRASCSSHTTCGRPHSWSHHARLRKRTEGGDATEEQTPIFRYNLIGDHNVSYEFGREGGDGQPSWCGFEGCINACW